MAVIRVDDVLDETECALLRRAWDDHKDSFDLIRSDVLFQPEFLSTINKVIKAAQDEFKLRIALKNQFLESIVVSGLAEGGYHPEHADHARLHDGAWVPNHTPNRTSTATLFLNDDFEGGELHFPNRVTFSPKRGMFIGFPADRHHLHEVLPVRSGTRHVLVLWMTNKIEHALRLPEPGPATSK